MGLQIEIKHHQGALIIRLKGELDHHTADRLRTEMDQAIQGSAGRNIVLSLKELAFMDSSGLGVILGRYKRIAESGGKLVVCDVHPHMHRLFEMSGLYKIIALEADEQTALSNLGVAL